MLCRCRWDFQWHSASCGQNLAVTALSSKHRYVLCALAVIRVLQQQLQIQFFRLAQQLAKPAESLLTDSDLPKLDRDVQLVEVDGWPRDVPGGVGRSSSRWGGSDKNSTFAAC